MTVRDATPEDWPAIWPFLHEIVAAGDTFSYDPGMDEPTARAMWIVAPPGRTTVATDDDGTVVGSANMHRNRPGPGSHVASGNYMVDAAARGRGVGRALIEDSLRWVREQGFRGMQFNAVAATNTAALALYESVGFEVVGTVPGGFKHPTEGYVALLVLYLDVLAT